MSPDIEDLLRDQLRGAASGAPHHLGVDDQDVLARGHRAVVRRRILTVAGAAAATIAIVGTIGVLAPRVNNDALPAIPTPTVTPTPDPTPTLTSTASPSATVTTTPSATPSSTPATSGPAGTSSPSSTPSRTKTPSPSTTPASSLEWSDPMTVGGVTYRARLVRDGMAGDYPNYQAELRANGSLIYTRHDANGEYGLQALKDPSVVLGTFVGPLSDVVSENSLPVSGEDFDSIVMPFPDTGDEYPKGNVTFTVIKLPRPATVNENNNVLKMVVRNADGREANLGASFDY
ncbi:MAG: hypothetical protein ABIW49_07925 [Knoellia sp.]